MPDFFPLLDESLLFEQFEAAWQTTSRSPLEEFLSLHLVHLNLANPGSLLFDLVSIDLEYRWKRPPNGAGQQMGLAANGSPSTELRWTVGDYVARIPELGQQPQLLESLYEQEYRVRRRWGEWRGPQDFRLTYPSLWPKIAAQLAEVERDLNHEQDSLRDLCREWNTPAAFDLTTDAQREINDLRSSDRQPARYRIINRHAKGGLGEVFVAQDQELNREVALKEIQSRFAGDPESRARFVREAEITGKLEHPGIVPIYGLGVYDDGRPYYAMRLIRGNSLGSAIASYQEQVAGASFNPGERKLRLQVLLRHFIDVCHALEYAHSRGILHRDLKPGNIMLGEYGETMVVDWGLAKSFAEAGAIRSHHPSQALIQLAESVSAPTQLGAIVGTPGYMSPEQAAGQVDSLTRGSDIYSLGATLYTIVTGVPPFAGDHVGTVIERVQRGEFRPPRAVDPQISRALEAIVVKAMATQPDSRYCSAKLLAADIERWLAGEPVTAYSEPLATRFRRWVARRKLLVTAGSLVCLAVVVVTTIVGQYQATLLRSRNDLVLKDHALEAQRKAVLTEKFYAGLLAVQQRSRERNSGWIRENQSAIEAVAASGAGNQSSRQVLRNELATLLTSYDLQRDSQPLSMGFGTFCLAADPRGEWLALGANIWSGGSAGLETGSIRVRLLRLDRAEPAQFLHIPISVLHPKLLAGKADGVRSLRFSDDAKLLAVGSRFGQIFVFDFANGRKEKARIDAHEEYITTVHFLDDGKKLLSGSEDGHVKIWNLETNSLEKDLDLKVGVYDASIAGQWACIGVDGKGARLIDLTDYSVRKGRKDEIRPIVGNAMARFPNGDGVIAGRAEGLVVWSPTRETQTLRFVDPRTDVAHRAWVEQLTVSANGKWVASSDDQTVTIWDLVTRTPISTIPVGGAGRSVAEFHPTLPIVYVSSNRELFRYPIQSNPVCSEYLFCSSGIHRFAVSQGGGWIAAVSESTPHAYLQAQSVADRRGWQKELPPLQFTSMEFTSQPQAVVLSAGIPKTLQRYHLATGGLLDERIETHAPLVLKQSPTRPFIWCAGLRDPGELDHGAGLVETRDSQTLAHAALWINERAAIVKRQSEIKALGVGDSVVVVATNDGLLTILDGTTAQPVRSKPLPRPVEALAITADDQLICTGDRQGNLTLWKPQDLSELSTLPGHQGAVTGMAMQNVRGRIRVVTGGSDGRVCLWDVVENKLEAVCALEASTRAIRQLELSADRLFFFADGDLAVRCWDLAALHAAWRQAGVAPW